MTTFSKFSSTLLFLLLILSVSGNPQEILEWRGIDRSGSFESKTLLEKWPEEGPELILQVENLPKSYSSVIKKDDILYTTGIEDTSEILTAVRMDGSIIWNTIYGQAWTKSFPNARCTPTIEGNNAYVISGSGDMARINTESGKLDWSVKAAEVFNGSYGTWGYAESPLIVDDKMIFTPGGKTTTTIALNKNTGETIWTSESLDDNSAYCSPVLIKTESQKLIVTITASYVICFDAENGNIQWKFDYANVEEPSNGSDINPVTPLVRGREIFVTSGYNHIGLMLEMSDDYKSVKLKWKSSDMDVHHGGVVFHEGYIYGSNFATVVSGNWLCLDWDTGELKYDHDWNGKGSIILSQGLLICYDERRGNLALVKADPKGFDLISEFRIKPGGGPHWSHPTIYDDYLLMRHGQALMVYDISAARSQ